MKNAEILNENWNMLTSFFPEGWREMGRESGAIVRLRDFKSEEQLMRTLLIHIANGFSLRESVVVAKAAGIADVSDVALLKRLRSSLPWFGEALRNSPAGEPVKPLAAAQRLLHEIGRLDLG